MKNTRQNGLIFERGEWIGRDPRQMSLSEISALGHRKISPVTAIRRRCLDCCVYQAGEVRKCVAVECPSWPFRMGVNPWHGKGGGGDHE